MEQWPREWERTERLCLGPLPRRDWRFSYDPQERLLQINLSRWPFAKIPPEMWQLIWQLPHLQELKIASHLLTTVPSQIGQLPHLQKLDLFSGNLTTLPPEIEHLANLDSFIKSTLKKFINSL